MRLPRFLVGSVVLSGALLACGGSSSETPLPLPPHPLNEPYRTRPVVARATPKADPRDIELDAEPTPAPPPAEPGPPARSTWGAPAPE